MIEIVFLLFAAFLASMVFAPLAGATGDELYAAPLNPAFISHVTEKSYATQSTSLKISPVPGDRHRLGFVPAPIYRPEIKDIQFFDSPSTKLDTSYPARFDLRTLGKISPVKNQGSFGTCWAFATYGSLESTLLPTTPTPDFSEKNLANLAGFPISSNPNNGGNMWMSAAYMTRWNGPVEELTDPYPTGAWTSSSSYSPVKHIQNIVFFPTRTNRTDTGNLKGALTRWGALYSSFYWGDAFYNGSFDSYYQPAFALNNDPHGGGHAVTIVGWDDTYAATNFTTIPAGPGAWIVKNSWGADWGDNGYFYVSYYDKYFGSAYDRMYYETAAVLAESTSNYDTVYSYDTQGEVNDYFYSTKKTGGFANVFTANASETLTAIGFYTTDVNVTANISIYKNPTSGPVEGIPVAIFNLTLPYIGYNTINLPLSQQVPLMTGDNFSVVIQVANPTNAVYIPIEENIEGYSGGITSEYGQGYLLGSSGWTDIKTILGNSHVCVKAYTNSTTAPPIANFTASVTSGPAPLLVQFTDHSLGSPTVWNWSFGDNTWFNTTITTARNATHVYFNAGLYMVNLTATNAKGSTTKTEPAYINITAPSSSDCANGTTINQSATIFIGEQGLNVTHALNLAQGNTDIDGIPPLTTIGWWESAESVGSAAPSKTIDLTNRYSVLFVAPIDFVNYTGNWYVLEEDGFTPAGEAFTVSDPNLSIRILDFTHDVDVTGRSVPQNTRLGFGITTNLYPAVDARYRGPINPATDGYIDIKVKNTNGATLHTLYNNSESAGGLAGPNTLLSNFVNVQPWSWGSGVTWSWQTNARDNTSHYAYPPGIYTFWTESTLNHMKENYRNGSADYTGKTVSPISTIQLRACGDFNGNGAVDIGDVSRVSYMVVGLIPVDMAADFNNVGSVDIGDATKIAWFSVGKITGL